MSVTYAEDLPEDERPPDMGDWVAIAQPHGCNYLIVAHWKRGCRAPVGRQYRQIIREVREYVEVAEQRRDAPQMPFYWGVGGVWVGVVDPKAVDWSPHISYNALPA